MSRRGYLFSMKMLALASVLACQPKEPTDTHGYESRARVGVYPAARSC